MKLFVTSLLVFATLAGSFEPTASLFNSDDCCITFDNSTSNPENTDQPSKTPSDCSSHPACIQCHFGNCHFVMTNLVLLLITNSPSLHTIEDFAQYNDVYLPGFNRPPIA